MCPRDFPCFRRLVITNIYVGNLSYSTTEDELLSLFQGYGSVSSAKIIFDRYTNKSKGFGFVEMEDDTEANNAIASLNNTEFQGRTIRVNVARERR
ncbi:MAG: RNA-binding protein [Spirochaetales bacterium]|nr:RNA-binding protein [Spirochaetales bacterium]MCF7939365.1 RNA-binding protein [Spirochaetales bacterium]